MTEEKLERDKLKQLIRIANALEKLSGLSEEKSTVLKTQIPAHLQWCKKCELYDNALCTNPDGEECQNKEDGCKRLISFD